MSALNFILMGASAAGKTVTAQFTAGTATVGGTVWSGYDTAQFTGSSFGSSMAPAILPDGKTVKAVLSNFTPPIPPFAGAYGFYLAVSGFASDPGYTGYFETITAGGVTLYAAAATGGSGSYSYSSGTAKWTFVMGSSILPMSGTVPFILGF